VTHTTFQELLLTPCNVHEILGFEILSSEKHFCHLEISEILLRVRGLDPCLETKENHKNQKNHMIFPYDFFCDFSMIFPIYDVSEFFYDFYRIK